MKLPRVHICLGVRADASCVTLYAGANGTEAEKAFANAPQTAGEIGGVLLFKYPLPNKRKTFPVTAPASQLNEASSPLPADLDIEGLAGAMYERYSEAVGGVAFNGDPLPKWSEFATDANKAKQADAWRAVAGSMLATPKIISSSSDEPAAAPAADDAAATPNESAAAAKTAARKTSSRRTAGSSSSDQL